MNENNDKWMRNRRLRCGWTSSYTMGPFITWMTVILMQMETNASKWEVNANEMEPMQTRHNDAPTTKREREADLSQQ